MAGDEAQELFNEFLCGKAEEQQFQEGKSFWNEELAQQTTYREIVADLSGGIKQPGASGKSVMQNRKFAKFFYLRLIGLYYAGDFTFETFDDDFSRQFADVWPEIISKGFYGTIYIGFDEWLYDLERTAVLRKEKQWWKEEHFPLSKIRLYIMETEAATEVNEGERRQPVSTFPTFRSVWTNVGGIRIDPNRLVRFSINGISNFVFLWDVLDKYFDGLDLYDRFMAMATKRIMVDVQNSQKAAQEAWQLLNSNLPFIAFNNAGKGGSNTDNDWDEFPAPDLEGIAIVMKAILARLDERLRFIGAYGKAMGQTKERKQVGETWLDHKWVNNVREVYKLKIDAMIKGLKLTFKGRVPNDLRIKVTSQEPHMDERFKDMHNWKGDNFYEGNHANNMKPLEQERKFIKG